MKRRLRASVMCEAEGHLLLVRLRDPVTHVATWFPPGGGIEDGETPEETARRETLEETGLRVRVETDEPRPFAADYPFTWAGVEYAITTHWFRATLLDPFVLTIPSVVDAAYNLGAAWLPINEALRESETHPDIFEAMRRILGR